MHELNNTMLTLEREVGIGICNDKRIRRLRFSKDVVSMVDVPMLPCMLIKHLRRSHLEMLSTS